MTGCSCWLGDCLDVLKSYPDGHFHALITDPPFTAAGGSTNGRSGGAVADSQFFVFWMQAVFREIRRVVVPSACGFIFCDWRTIGAVGRVVRSDRGSSYLVDGVTP